MKSRDDRCIASLWVVAGLLVSFAGLSISANVGMAAGDTVIRGVVTDEAGKPIRAAVVKATSGSKTVVRFRRLLPELVARNGSAGQVFNTTTTSRQI